MEFVDIGTVFDVPTTVMSLGSLQVTAPTAGFVVLALSGYAITFGDNTVCVVGFGTTANAITLGRVQVGTLDGTGTAREQRSIAMLFILPVSGGTNTFFINAQKPSTFSAASVNLDSVFAAALFVPKRY